MLIDLIQIFADGTGPTLASFRSGIGSAVVRWAGSPQDPPGSYHVEWTIEDALVWGDTMQPAAAPIAAVGAEGGNVMLRGRLDLTDDDTVAVLELDTTQPLIELASPLPAGVAGTWVEIRVPRDRVALYPYFL
jgi:hypothetical protein